MLLNSHLLTSDYSSFPRIISADFATAAILVSFGAFLGVANSLQLFGIAFIETLFYAVNEGICTSILYVTDNAKTFYVHIFGSIYGAVVARMLYRGRIFRTRTLFCASYESGTFALIGKYQFQASFPYFFHKWGACLVIHKLFISILICVRVVHFCCLDQCSVTFFKSQHTYKTS